MEKIQLFNLHSNILNYFSPVGVILPYLPGYFTDNNNGTYTGVNLELADNWRICNGSLCNDPESPIFNGSGRYLPNLTDSRFLMGGTSPGTPGGSKHSYTEYTKYS